MNFLWSASPWVVKQDLLLFVTFFLMSCLGSSGPQRKLAACLAVLPCKIFVPFYISSCPVRLLRPLQRSPELESHAGKFHSEYAVDSYSDVSAAVSVLRDNVDTLL